jgi:NADPH:quinone reductase-like Zn-dependent oxidoreductase
MKMLMKAIHWKNFGGAEALELGEFEKPVPKPDELLIKVKAFTVNRTDCAMLKSSLWIMRLQTGFFRPNKPVLGTDFAGEVVATGAKVDRFKIGDRLFGFDDSGIQSHAEYLTIKQSNALAKIPEKVDFTIAAASIEGPHYAINFLNKISLKPDQSVFVHGGTGGIGSALVQLVKNHGGKVTTSTRSEHINLLQELGADEVVDYTASGFWHHHQQHEYVFDAVGKGSFNKFKSWLRGKGVYISSELGPGAQNLFLALLTPLLGGKRVKFPVPLNRQKSVDLMANLLTEGKYQPLIDQTFDLKQTPEAFAYVLQGQKIGNVIISL